eukprot:TRINITY_DN1631_c0_g1_i8.p1 TRINITY_DN1631_c0_g1~~TRINITY_DN1631_c0_g1_i8.p1  ORF type:complete len:573 (-),score=122.15 TRINITY_DN1631_c0_g1_i8:1064-2782(-)
MGYVITPLTFSTFKELIDSSMSMLCASQGIPYSAEFGIYDLRRGRVYQNVNVTGALSARQFGATWKQTCEEFELPEEVCRLSPAYSVSAWGMVTGVTEVIKMMWKSGTFLADVSGVVTASRNDALRRFADACQSECDGMHLSDAFAELEKLLRDFIGLGRVYMDVSIHTMVYSSLLTELLHDPPLHTALLTGLGDVWTATQNERLLGLVQLAEKEERAKYLLLTGRHDEWREQLQGTEFLEAFTQFLLEFGFRGDRELEVACPRWLERPPLLLRLVACLMDKGTDCGDCHEDVPVRRAKPSPQELRVNRDAAVQMALSRQSFLLRTPTKHVIGRLQETTRWKENAKSVVVLYIALARCYLRRMASLLAADEGAATDCGGESVLQSAEDIFYLSLDDLRELVPLSPEQRLEHRQAVRARVEVNRRQMQQHEGMVAPDVFVGAFPAASNCPAAVAASSPGATDVVVTGVGASLGTSVAPAFVAASISDAVRAMPAGHVLVCQATDPAWTPLFLKASAVVVEYGGLLSHSAITARELGIPAVVGASHCTTVFHTGDVIAVDGRYGTAKLVKVASP